MPTTARTVRLSIFSLGVVAAVLSCGGAAHAGEPAAQAEARAILAATGIKGGLIVHVGCGDGRLTAALRANGSYLVHGLDDAAANVEKARSHIASLRLYGKVSVAPWRGKRLPYTDNLVNLLVSADPGNVTMDEVMRVLCPNGVAYIKKDDTWTKTVKPRPTNIDEWTHYLHDASNNAVAGDTVVGPPQHLQWVGAPKWARSHDHLASISVVVSSGGRIFYIMDEGPIATVALPPKWSLVARGAFNGVPLWKRSMGPWERHLRGFRSGPAGLARRLVAVKDRVYVTLGYGKPVVALDATTGRTAKMYEGTENAREIVCQGGLLFVVVGDAAQGRRLGAARRDRWRSYSLIEPKKRLAAVSAKTGKLLWTKTGADTVDLMPTTLAVAGGRVFFQNPKEIICLDAKSGKEQWRAARPIRIGRLGWSTPTLVVYGDVVLSADRARPGPAKANAAGPGRVRWAATSKGGDAPVGELIAYSVKDGEKLWNCPCREIYNAPVDVLVAGGLVWTGNMVRANEPGINEGRDPATGEVKKRRPPDKKFFSVGMGHHRCYRNKATDRYLVLGRAGVEFIELATGTGIANHWVRGACQYGVVPCNGLLYAPSHSCACYIQGKLNGFNALAPKRKPVAAQPSDVRLERGPAYDAIRNPQSAIRNSDEWPTYRHDAARSGSTKTAVPAAVKPAWQTDVGGKLSSVVIAEGKVLVAQIDSHTVHALDAKDGTRAWSYTAGGRVDSPRPSTTGWRCSAAPTATSTASARPTARWRGASGPRPRTVASSPTTRSSRSGRCTAACSSRRTLSTSRRAGRHSSTAASACTVST